MGDRSTLEKARKELEEMYLGVPDDSVNLTFQDLAQIRQTKKSSSPSPPMETVTESSDKTPSNLSKLPSLDFNRGLQASFQSTNHHQTSNYNQDHHDVSPRNFNHQGASLSPRLHTYGQDHHDVSPRNFNHHRPDQGASLSPKFHTYGQDHHVNAHTHQNHHASSHSGDRYRHADERSVAFDDMSHVSGMSVAYGPERGGGRRRPGIPHSNICTICCNYIYIFRHRCLVCGRVYCRQCVRIGMGEMTEGRKCVECLGRRFSHRYIQKAGNVGCCMGYPSTTKQQELKWAEKGPRRSGENRYGHSVMVSRSRSPVSRPVMVSRSRSPVSRPVTPTRPQISPSDTPSFVTSSSYSPYSTTGRHQYPPF